MRMTPTTYGAFLSTLSLRRATGKLPKPLTDCVFLSTLSLRRATLTTVLHWYHISISIHALLAESDTRHRTRGAVYKISIHALLAESDKRRLPSSWRRNHFYPRSPCGERLVLLMTVQILRLFLSTLSLRRATLLTVVPYGQ